jgi:hypothetical protein
MHINGLGVMTINTQPLDSALKPLGITAPTKPRVHLMANPTYAGGPTPGDTNQYVRSDAGFTTDPSKPLKLGRWENCDDYGHGIRSCLYVNSSALLDGWGTSSSPTSGGSGVDVVYIKDTVGRFNVLGETAQGPRVGESFKRRSAQYKILRVSGVGKIVDYCILDPGEGYSEGDKLLFDDPGTFNGILRDDVVRTNAASVTLSKANLSQDFITAFGAGPNKTGFAMESVKIYPAMSIGFTSQENADNPISTVGTGGKRDADIMVELLPKEPLPSGGIDVFTIAVTQNVHYANGVNDKLVKTLIHPVSCDTWADEITLSGDAPEPLTNWSSFTPGQRLRITMDVRDVYNFEVKLSHMDATGTTFEEEQRLAGTGYIIEQGIETTPVLQTTRDSQLPLIPILKLSPCQFAQSPGFISYRYDGRFASTTDFFTNYTLIAPVTSTLSNLSDKVVDGKDPRICIKTSPLSRSQISASPASTNEVSAVDFDPHDSAGFGLIGGLHSAYFIDQGTTGAQRTFTAKSTPHVIPFFGAYSIEMPNLPLKGWVGKAYDLTGTRRGIGQQSSIMHIVNADNNITSIGSTLSVFDYTAKFPMPVHVCLDNPTAYQSMQFRLRNIETGELMRDLLHPTQIVFRVIPKDPKQFDQISGYKNNMS